MLTLFKHKLHSKCLTMNGRVVALLVCIFLGLTTFAETSYDYTCIDGIIYRLDKDSDNKVFSVSYSAYDDASRQIVLREFISIDGIEFRVNDLDGISISSESLVSVEAIGEISGVSFRECPKLQSVDWPNINIENYMFFDCPSLDPVPLLNGKDINSIGSGAFALSEPTIYEAIGNINLKWSELQSDMNSYYYLSIDDSSYNSILANRLYMTVTLMDGDPQDTYLTLKLIDLSGVKNLSVNGYFSGELKLPALEQLTVKDIDVLSFIEAKPALSVALIGNIGHYSQNGAVQSLNLEKLEKIEKIKIYGDAGFSTLNLYNKCRELEIWNCSDLTEILQCGNVAKATISGCDGITSLSLPDIESLDRSSVRYLKELTEIYLGEKLKSAEISPEEVYSSIFPGCTKIKDVIFGGTLEQWMSIDFKAMNADEDNGALYGITNFWYGDGPSKTNLLSELNYANVGTATEIPKWAFTGYKGLVAIDLPPTVKKIGISAFLSCSNLTKVNINVETIGQWAFLYDPNITEMSLGSNLRYIGPAFNSSYKNLTLNYLGTLEEWVSITRTTNYYDPDEPDKLMGYNFIGTPEINGKTFMIQGEVNDFEEIELHNPIQISGGIPKKNLKLVTIFTGPMAPKIVSYAFNNCYKLEVVAWHPETELEKGFDIGEGAFQNCSVLHTIEPLKSIKSIGFGALDRTAWLNNQSQNTMAYFETEKGLTAYTYVGDAPDNTCIDLDEGCKSINNGAFNTVGCEGITSINIPSTVEYIGEDAFSGTRLSGKLTVPSSVKYLGGSFLNKGSLEYFEIEDSTEPLEISGESYAPQLKAVYFGRDIAETSSGRLFSNIEENVEVTLGSQVTEVGDAMNVGYNVKNYTVRAMTPPVVKEASMGWYTYYPAFEDLSSGNSIDFDRCPLVVPEGTAESYRSATGWSKFKNIVEDESSLIIDVVSPSFSEFGVRHYDLNGRLISSESKGIHIVIDATGKVTKQLIR